MIEGCTVTVLLNGDSTAWGYEPKGGGARTAVYPELALQQAMDVRFGVGTVLVRTGAVSGTTSTDALVQPRDADIVVYNSGINDVAYGHGESQYWKNLRILALEVPGAVFQTPLPVFGTLRSYDEIMRAVAIENAVPLIEARAWAEAMGDWWAYATDGVHPSSAGYAELVKVQMPVLTPLVLEKCATGVVD
jgi:lysophospholipase L1-like esterase